MSFSTSFRHLALESKLFSLLRPSVPTFPYRTVKDFPWLVISQNFPPLLESDYTFDVGLRQKCYGTFTDAIGMNAVNSRFGLDLEGIAQAAKIIADAPNLRLTVYHGMIGSQLTDYEAFPPHSCTAYGV